MTKSAKKSLEFNVKLKQNQSLGSHDIGGVLDDLLQEDQHENLGI